MPAARLKIQKLNEAEELLLFQVAALRLPPSRRNYKFHSERRWEIDLAWPALKIGIEIQGGVWMEGKGAHSRPQNIERDMEKHNALLDAGWRVYHYTPRQIRLGEAFGHIERILAGVGRQS